MKLTNSLNNEPDKDCEAKRGLARPLAVQKIRVK